MKKNLMSKLFVQRYNNEILGVSGFTRSGKAMIMNLISTFKYVEKSNTDILLEQIYYLHKIKKINSEVAIYLLKKNLNITQFYNSIGRNVNFKKNDFSSAYNYHDPSLYIKRSNSLTQKLNTIPNKYLFQIMLHSGMNSGKLLLQSSNSLKIIEIFKNPVELVFSWIKKNYGKDIYKKPNVYVLTIKYKNEILPFYAKNWENKYLKMNQYERCAHMIFQLYDDRKNQIRKLNSSEKKRILFINFDNFVNKPLKELDKISDFINKKPTKKTFINFKKEKIPRKSFNNEYYDKVQFLEKKLTKKTFEILKKYEKEYFKQLDYEK